MIRILSLFLLTLIANAALLTFEALEPVPFTKVVIDDAFWSPRRATNRVASIPANLENLYRSGVIKNFELAAQGATNGFNGRFWFMDSDVYKALEAFSYSLAVDPDVQLERTTDEIIAKIAAAQGPDGYVNTYFTLKAPGQRWTNLRDAHELYCAGHMFEAAVAHYQATGKRTFLDIAIKNADLIDSIFGPPPKRLGYPGHPKIELALIKLWRATGEQRYFDLARFFVENRGTGFFAGEHNTPPDEYDGTYWQDDVPIFDHANIKGHAVRAAYLMSGVTDVFAQTRDEELGRMLRRVWRNTTEKNLYVTGGIGPSSHNEGFTMDYDLPNLTAYQETCASVALVQWSHRLALLYGEARYADMMERSLYNGVLAGVSLDGTRFFYVNPLASRGTHHRSEWFSCACCPPNVTRTLAFLGGYAYATSDDALWVNLYIQGTTQATVGGTPVKLSVTTDYPWDGDVTLRLEPRTKTSFDLRLRKPGWCSAFTVKVNRRRLDDPRLDRGYIVLQREWRKGDRVKLEFAMPVERIAAHPRVGADAGRLAIQRGPLIYCVEQCDLDALVDALFLPREAGLEPVKDEHLLGGVVKLVGEARVADELDWHGVLYQPAPNTRAVAITAVPYNVWDNRAPGAMAVWLPTAPKPSKVGDP